MTAIQESNFKRISTQKLFEDFKVFEDNLSLELGDLRINRGYIYNQDDVFKDITVIDMAIDRCGTLYFVDDEQNLYRFHANEKILEKIASIEKTLSVALKTITAIGVDKDTIYIADCVSEDSKNQIGRNARLIAFTKKDLQIRWVLSTDPNGNPLNEISTIQCDNQGKVYILEGSEKRIFCVSIGEACYPKFESTEKIFSLELNTVSAVGADKDTIYIADYISKDSKNQTNSDDARLIALAKEGLQIRWILSTDYKGRKLNRINNVGCSNRGKIYILEGNDNRRLYVNANDVFHRDLRPADEVVNESFKLENGNFKLHNLSTGIDGAFYLLFVNTEDSANTERGTKGYILKALSTKKEKSIEVIEPKIIDFSPSGILVDTRNQIFIGESKSDGTLTIRKLSNDAIETWIPLTIYEFSNETTKRTCKELVSDSKAERTCKKLVSDSKGNLYIIDNENKLTLLACKKSNLQNKKGYFEGTYISKPIDSQNKGTRWHRLLLEGEFEKGTQVDFQYYVSDIKLSDEYVKKLGSSDWLNCISKASAIQGSSKRDALFIDNAEGQYLWFKLTLSGNEVLSPVIKSVTVFFPRISYLDYLPGIYQENPVSKGLLERFLAIFESIFYEIDFTIDHISRYFDTYGAPAEFLSWLGSWLDVSMDEDWPEDKKRLFIRSAVSLYKKRGTREGMEESIELFTGKKPFVVERFQAFKECTGNISQPCNKEKITSLPSQERIFFPPNELKVKECPENGTAKDKDKEKPLINKLYGTEIFGFYVLLSDADLDTTSQSHVRRIIEEQKPAHTSYELKVLEPLFYLDMHTYLEINTVVTEPRFVLEKTSMIGRDTVLHDEEKAGQIEKHSRVGVDILLS